MVLCPGARAILGDLCEGEAVDFEFLRVTRVAPARPRAAPAVRKAPVAKDLASLAPQVARDRLAVADRRWLAEFRNLSIIAAQFPQDDDDQFLHSLQHATLALQTTAARYEGAILDFIPSECGACAYIVFGLPPLGHSDDPYRAVEASKTLQRILGDAGVANSIGVASGRLFCEPPARPRLIPSATARKVKLTVVAHDFSTPS